MADINRPHEWYIVPPAGKMRWPDNEGEQVKLPASRTREQAAKLVPTDRAAAMQSLAPSYGGARVHGEGGDARTEQYLLGRIDTREERKAAMLARAQVKRAAKAARKAAERNGQ